MSRVKTLFFAVIAVGILFLAMTAGYRLLTERMAGNQLFAVLVDDQPLLLDGRTLEQFNTDLARLSTEQQEQTSVAVAAWIDQWVDDAFGLAIDAVPGYMDWYYSMGGSYTRLYLAVRGELDEGLGQRMDEHLLDKSGFADRLAEFDQALEVQLERMLGEQANQLRAEMNRLYEDRQVDEGRVDIRSAVQLDMDSAIRDAFTASAEDIQRWRISSQASAVAGVGALAWLARRAILPRLMTLGSVQGARRVVAAYTARLAPRMAAAIGAGGSVAAATAPTGPGALVAGSVAFATAAGTIVITDFALLKAEEAMLRDDKQQELIDELVSSRETTRQLLHQQMIQAVAQTEQTLLSGLARPYDQADVQPRFHIFGTTRAAP